MGILVDMSGDTLRRFRAKGWTIGRSSVNVLDWDINDVFLMAITTQGLTGTVHDLEVGFGY